MTRLVVLKNVFSAAKLVTCSTMLCIFLLSEHVPHCTGRRGITRPHIGTADRPADFYFARTVIQPCGVGRDLVEIVTREEVINMVHIVRERVNYSKLEMVSL